MKELKEEFESVTGSTKDKDKDAKTKTKTQFSSVTDMKYLKEHLTPKKEEKGRKREGTRGALSR